MTPDPDDFDPDLHDAAAAALLVLAAAAAMYFFSLVAGVGQ